MIVFIFFFSLARCQYQCVRYTARTCSNACTILRAAHTYACTARYPICVRICVRVRVMFQKHAVARIICRHIMRATVSARTIRTHNMSVQMYVRYACTYVRKSACHFRKGTARSAIGPKLGSYMQHGNQCQMSFLG